MPLYEFTCFINVEAENEEDAVNMFDSNVRYGLLNKNDIYVADIEEKI
jgi:hypothetical protein